MFYHGTHIFVTIRGGGKVFEYTARDTLDARGYIEATLKLFPGYDVHWDGDVIVYFVYPREGD
jgi:hypothetical protein